MELWQRWKIQCCLYFYRQINDTFDSIHLKFKLQTLKQKAAHIMTANCPVFYASNFNCAVTSLQFVMAQQIVPPSCD